MGEMAIASFSNSESQFSTQFAIDDAAR